MKAQKFFLGLLAALLFGFAVSFTARADVVPQNEVYGTASDGTVLHWDVYSPTTPGPWPAVLVIHGGGFDKGTPDSASELVDCAQNLAAAGYIAFSIEYRLAPPGALPGQVSDGRFPDQSDDVKLAVRTARNDPRCNGQVGAVGGSGGGYQTAFVAATGTIGDDRIDVGVSLSGLYDCSDFSPSESLAGYTADVTNYIPVPTTDTETLRSASPAWLADANTAPLFMVNSVRDSMPYFQLPDMIAHLDALGLKNYQALTLFGNGHSWENWDAVKDAALTFLANGFAGVPPPPPIPPSIDGLGSKQLINVSTRANVGLEQNVTIGGFIVTGDSAKRVVLRGLGPSLGQAGLSGVLADPVMELYDIAGNLVEACDNPTPIPGIANPLWPADPSEVFMTAILPPGSYTAVLHGVNNTSGLGLIEVFDINPSTSRVGNISTRGQVGSGDDAMIGGFIVGGPESAQVIVRALGPSLAPFGISSPLSDPTLELHDGNGALLFANDNWRSDQQQQISDAGFAPPDSHEAAIIATLPPGGYTAVVQGANSTTGVALVEAYDLEP